MKIKVLGFLLTVSIGMLAQQKQLNMYLDTTKYSSKINQQATVSADIPLPNGEEIIVNVKTVAVILNLSEEDKIKLCDISLIERVNNISMKRCKYELTWVPKEILILQSEGEILYTVQGRASNAFNTPDKITFLYHYKDGNFNARL